MLTFIRTLLLNYEKSFPSQIYLRENQITLWLCKEWERKPIFYIEGAMQHGSTILVVHSSVGQTVHNPKRREISCWGATKSRWSCSWRLYIYYTLHSLRPTYIRHILRENEKIIDVWTETKKLKTETYSKQQQHTRTTAHYKSETITLAHCGRAFSHYSH